MIVGTGIDIVRIARIQRVFQRFQKRFIQRILHPNEQAFTAITAAFLAKRFAAKEAAVKALGSGFRQGIGFHSIEIRSGLYGQPTLHFHAAAQVAIEKLAVRSSHLSISDEDTHVVASVILEC